MEQKSANTLFEFNVYDLNIAQTLKKDIPYVLERELITNPRFKGEHLIWAVRSRIEKYCRDFGLDFDFLLQPATTAPIIIDSSHNEYFYFLVTALEFYDPFLIKHFLTYQYNNFKGNADAKNQEEFLAMILFSCYDLLKMNSFNDNLHRKEKIFDWIEEYNIKDLPQRFSTRQATVNDNRYKGKLTPQEVSTYWMQLCNYKIEGVLVEVLEESDVKHFLHSNFWGFSPKHTPRKLKANNITQARLRRFCKKFFDDYSENNKTTVFVKILKANFSNFDGTSESNLIKNFSK